MCIRDSLKMNRTLVDLIGSKHFAALVSSPIVTNLDKDNNTTNIIIADWEGYVYCLSVHRVISNNFIWNSIGYRFDLQNTGNFTDKDKDGLTDVWELEIGTDPFSNDTDKDGISDYEEFILGLNPFMKDIEILNNDVKNIKFSEFLAIKSESFTLFIGNFSQKPIIYLNDVKIENDITP